MIDPIIHLEERIDRLRREQDALPKSTCERWWLLQTEIEELGDEARFETGRQREAGCV